MNDIKNHVHMREDLVWPVADVTSFHGQKAQLHLHEYLMPYVNNRSVLVQAGGNCGMVLNTLVSYFDSVYTFEPDPINFYCLNQNTTDSRVIKIQGCLGNTTTPVNVKMVDNLPDIGGFHVSGTGAIPMFKLDNLELPNCGLIFLDVEGYEHETLLGSVQTIQKYKPVLFFEVEHGWLYRHGSSPEALTEFLHSINYKKVNGLKIGNNELWVYNH